MVPTRQVHGRITGLEIPPAQGGWLDRVLEEKGTQNVVAVFKLLQVAPQDRGTARNTVTGALAMLSTLIAKLTSRSHFTAVQVQAAMHDLLRQVTNALITTIIAFEAACEHMSRLLFHDVSLLEESNHCTAMPWSSVATSTQNASHGTRTYLLQASSIAPDP